VSGNSCRHAGASGAMAAVHGRLKQKLRES